MKKSFNKFNKNKRGVKTMKRLILIIGLLFIVLSVPIFSEATPVTINNSGFESNFLADGSWQMGITGWPMSSSAGVWNPPAGYFSTGIPEGNNVAWINSGVISQQVVGYSLIADTRLTLSVDVGWRLDYMSMPGYAIQLWAGNTLLDTESSMALVQGGFVTSMLTYNVTNLNPYLGQQLSIVLTRTGGGQVNFDNVRLENDSTAVPEPSTLLLLGSGLVGFGYFIRRRRG